MRAQVSAGFSAVSGFACNLEIAFSLQEASQALADNSVVVSDEYRNHGHRLTDFQRMSSNSVFANSRKVAKWVRGLALS